VEVEAAQDCSPEDLFNGKDVIPCVWITFANRLAFGLLPDGLVTIIDVKWHGSDVVELIYRDSVGKLGSELLYRDREPTLGIATAGVPWSFDGDGALFRLVSEAHLSVWRTYSTLFWLSIPRWWSRYHTRSQLFTKPCFSANRSGFCWQMTLELGRQLWLGC
jgi:hypothetical protein